MKAIIISIGDELLIGQVINTNAPHIAERLNGVGVEVVEMLTVGDSEEAILASFGYAWEHFDVVVVTGGLGPTHDDITRAAVCKFFQTDLVVDPASLENIKALMARWNYPWTKEAEGQALVPRAAVVIPNGLGTAPGYLFSRHKKYCVVMPGVPHEMESMMKEFVVPHFTKIPSGRVILHRTLNTTGIAESILAERLGNIDELVQETKLAFLPSSAGVRLRISVAMDNRAAAEEAIRQTEVRIREKAEKFIYSTDDEPIEVMLGRLLQERRLRLAVAESCTGGLIAHRLTNIPGSSTYFERGLVTYSNASKTELLEVPPELINKHGAVSKEVAEAMAEGVRKCANVDIGISTTGIAGPTGSSIEKPVGLVCIGYAYKGEISALSFNFGPLRTRVKERAAQAAFNLLRRKLLNIE